MKGEYMFGLIWEFKWFIRRLIFQIKRKLKGDNMKTETVELKSGNGDFLKHKCTEVYQPEHRYIFDLECKQCDYKN